MNYLPPRQSKQQPMGFRADVVSNPNEVGDDSLSSTRNRNSKSMITPSSYASTKTNNHTCRDNIKILPSSSKTYPSDCSNALKVSKSSRSSSPSNSLKKKNTDVAIFVSPDNNDANKASSNMTMVTGLPSLISVQDDTTDNNIITTTTAFHNNKEEESESVSASSSSSSSSSSSEDDIIMYGYGDDAMYAPKHDQQNAQQEQCYASTDSNDMAIVEDGDDEEEEEEEKEEDRDKYGYGVQEQEEEIPTRQYSSRNEFSSVAFCPHRMPRRSSMKGSSPNDGGGTVVSISTSTVRSRHSNCRRRASTTTSSLSSTSRIIQREDIEVMLPGRQEPVKRRRSIIFDTDISVQQIEPVQFMAKNGSKELWFQENEYETIKIKTLALLDRVGDKNLSGIVNGKKYCTRGLERFMTPETSEVKKHQAWDSVLNEQFLQRQDGEYDEEILANIYKYSTKRSQTEASKRADQDAEAAKTYLKATSQSFEKWKARS